METNWISVGDLAASFAASGNTLDPVADLAGRSFDIDFGAGEVINHRFVDHAALTWHVRQTGETGHDIYRATALRPHIYFIDFVKSSARATSVSLVLDLELDIATVVIGTLPDAQRASIPAVDLAYRKSELTGVEVRIHPGTIDRTFDIDSPTHEATRELLGKRIQYRYNPHESYEHIYLNEKMYTWHCLSGIEQGLADTDRCHYHRVRDGLYLFVWREKIVPTLGVIMIDLEQLKTTGKIFGYADEGFSALSNFPVGAHATVLAGNADMDVSKKAR